VLDGVSGLVRRDAEGGEAGAVVVVFRESQPLLARVVMVGQLARHADDLHIMDARALHDGGRRLPATDVATRGYADVLVVGARDAHLRIEAEQERNDDEDGPD
jgi:hypothetical protein